MLKKNNLTGESFIPGTMTFIFILLLTVFPVSDLSGQSTEDVDASLEVIQQNVAPVKVDGNFLFNVHGISSYPAEQRAETISTRIKRAASEPQNSSDSVKIIESDGRSEIFAGREFIMNIYDIDARIENIDRTTLMKIYSEKIQSSIKLYRYDRSKQVLIRRSIYAFGVALLLTIFLISVIWLIKRMEARLDFRIRSGAESLERKSFTIIKSSHLVGAIRAFYKFLKICAYVIVVVVFLEYVLGLFPWTSNVAVSVLNLFIKPLKTLGNGFLAFLPSLAFLIVLFFVTRYLLKVIRLLFTGIDQGAIHLNNFYPSWAMPTFKIVRLFIIAFAVVVAYPYIPGSQSMAFKGVTVFMGVLFSLGSSSFIGNIIAGYSMTYRMAFKKGDLIQVDDQIGFVEEQKILVTRLRSHKNEEIVLPNSVLQNSKIINFSAREKDSRLILHTRVGIGYETPWRQVDAMLKLAASRTQGLLQDPPPFVLKESLGDYAINYEINVFCGDVANIKAHYSNLHQNILDVFNENKVQIMTPSYVMDPEAPKVVPRDQWDIPLSHDK